MGHNDFEAGDVAAYMIGPLDEAPRTVALLNDAPDAGDMIHGRDRRAGPRVRSPWIDARFFKGLWGYHADFVDEAH